MSYEQFSSYTHSDLVALEQIYTRLLSVNIARRDNYFARAKPIPLQLFREITTYKRITCTIREVLESHYEKVRA